MAAELSNLDSLLLPPPPAFRYRFEPLCPLVGEQGSLCSSGSGSDSGLSSPPLTPSEALTSSDEDDDYLAELTLRMANDMLQEQNDEGQYKPASVPAALSGRDMPRWVDLFAVSRQSTHDKKASIPADESPRENSGAKGDPSWDTQPAHKTKLVEISDKIEPVQTISRHDRNRWSHDLNPGLRSYQTSPSDGNWTKEQSGMLPERAPKQANSPTRKTRAKNNQARTRRGLVQGEYYVGLSLLKPQKAATVSGVTAVPPGTGTGVFLPKATGNPTEQRRKPRCSTVLIPARVAQSLMVHFSKMSYHHQSRPSVGGGGGDSSYFQQKGQADPEPEPVINCNEMGLPQEWMY